MEDSGVEARLGRSREVGMERGLRTPARYAVRIRGLAERLVDRRSSQTWPQIRDCRPPRDTRRLNRRAHLPPRPPLRDRDLSLQEIDEIDALRLQLLRIERGLGQARQGVGLEIDRPVV